MIVIRRLFKDLATLEISAVRFEMLGALKFTYEKYEENIERFPPSSASRATRRNSTLL
jgi:hypothetical protein